MKKKTGFPPWFKGFVIGSLVTAVMCWSLQPVDAEVGDNLGSAFTKLYKLIGLDQINSIPSDSEYETATLVEKINFLKDDNEKLRASLEDVKRDATILSSQVYLTMLEDYQNNGKASSVYNDRTQWDALCRSSVMHCSQKYSGEALDYYVENNLDLGQFFVDMGYTAATISTVSDIVANYSTIKSSSLCLYSLANSKYASRALWADSNAKSQFYVEANHAYFVNASRFHKTASGSCKTGSSGSVINDNTVYNNSNAPIIICGVNLSGDDPSINKNEYLATLVKVYTGYYTGYASCTITYYPCPV